MELHARQRGPVASRRDCASFERDAAELRDHIGLLRANVSFARWPFRPATVKWLRLRLRLAKHDCDKRLRLVMSTATSLHQATPWQLHCGSAAAVLTVLRAAVGAAWGKRLKQALRRLALAQREAHRTIVYEK